MIYFLLLANGYRHGDLSLVYPLARGTGPLITIVVAVLLLHEQPSAVGLTGALLVALGVFLLTGDPFRLRQSGSGSAVLFALRTGVCIAAYDGNEKGAAAPFSLKQFLQLDYNRSKMPAIPCPPPIHMVTMA